MGQKGKATYTHSILNDMIRVTRSNYLEDPSSLWHARLPALVSKSINELSYRQIGLAWRKGSHRLEEFNLLGTFLQENR